MGDLSCGITQYSFWLIVSTIVLLIVLAVFKKKQTLVPKGFFVNGFEYIIEYVENDIGKGVVGENWKKHFPFLCSLFLFILINNMIGLIPGMKPGTGAIGSTAALAIFAFVSFIYYGCSGSRRDRLHQEPHPAGRELPDERARVGRRAFSRPSCASSRLPSVCSANIRCRTRGHGPVCHHGEHVHAAAASAGFRGPRRRRPAFASGRLAILILIYAIELVVGAIQSLRLHGPFRRVCLEAEEVAEEE